MYFNHLSTPKLNITECDLFLNAFKALKCEDFKSCNNTFSDFISNLKPKGHQFSYMSFKALRELQM